MSQEQPCQPQSTPSTEPARAGKNQGMSRRLLLNAAAAGVGALAVGSYASTPGRQQRSPNYGQSLTPKPGRRILGANDRIQMGIIGSGGMGRHHMSIMNKRDDVEFIAVCDIYEANRNEGNKLCGGKAQLFNEHEKLLEMKEIDGVVIASPDHWHMRHLVDTVLAGKDAYCEKPMSWSIPQGVNMVKQVRRTDRIVQIGMQRRSTPSIMEAKKIVDDGFLGEVSLVRAQWFWNRPDLPETFEPKGQLDWDRFQAPLHPDERYPMTPENALKYQRWRYFWEYSGGNMTDQGTHLMDVIQWFLNDSKPPVAAQEHGAVYQIKGYETPDTFCAVFEYPKFMATWTLTYTNAWHNGWSIIFHGREGSLELDEMGARFYAEGNKGFAWDWQRRPPEPIHNIEGGLSVEEHEGNFLDCMRSRKEPNAPVEIGHQAVTALHLANAAHHAKKRAVLSDDGTSVSIP